jgi:hypothetical protein
MTPRVDSGGLTDDPFQNPSSLSGFEHQRAHGGDSVRVAAASKIEYVLIKQTNCA